MPELPEVETIRRQLSKHLPGLVLQKVEVLEAKLKTYLDPQAIKRVLDKEIVAVERVAKVLLLKLRSGDNLAFHLKMTGQVVLNNLKFPNQPNKYNRATLTFSDGTQVYFQDLRKFGWIKVLKDNQIPRSLFREPLGPEPFSQEFDLAYFAGVLKKSRQPIKVLLLDQAKIAGIGNIYANEALFISRLNPKMLSFSLTRPKIKLLYRAILEVLEKGIKLGGASDNSYLNAFGKKGKYQEHFLVYGQKGRECPKCQSKIIRISLGGRGTFLCPRCQA